MKTAILPWGNVIEDYLDPIDISLETFATEMEGGWLFGYAEALVSAGSEVCIFVVSRNVREPKRFVNPKSGIETIALPSPLEYRLLKRMLFRNRVSGYAALPARSLCNAFLTENCTHIILQEYTDPRFDRLAPMAKRFGLPLVASFQGGYAEPRSLVGKTLRRKALSQAAGLIIASSDEEKRMRAIHGDLRIARIFNPINPDIWYPESRAACRGALELPNAARIAICHCRIDVHRKGLDVLLAAWRQVSLRMAGTDIRLHLIGDGPDRDTLRRLIKNNPVPGLRWVDSFTQDRAEMRRELSAADLHVQASRHEGFAVAPMEAMACGLPTVLSRAPGAVDLLEPGEAAGGRLVPVGDANALADQITELLSDDAHRNTLGKAAREHVLAVGATQSVGQQLVEFLSHASA